MLYSNDMLRYIVSKKRVCNIIFLNIWKCCNCLKWNILNFCHLFSHWQFSGNKGDRTNWKHIYFLTDNKAPPSSILYSKHSGHFHIDKSSSSLEKKRRNILFKAHWDEYILPHFGQTKDDNLNLNFEQCRDKFCIWYRCHVQ